MLHQMIALLGVCILFSSTTTANLIPANECVNYTTLHEANRSRFFSSFTTKISDSLLTGWFAFNGSAGRHMSTSCVPANRCGTLVPGWMKGTHPGVQEGEVKRFVCFTIKQICCMTSVSMRVRNCSGFYVYKLDMMPSFGYNFRLCGAGYEEPTDDCFTKPVGVSDQAQIPDDHMTASSQYGNGYQAAYGRLNGDRGDGWCAKESNRNDDWLQVDLGTTFQVCAVASQGDRNGNEWVTDFKLSYSSDGNVWTPYKDANGVEVEFHRQGDSYTVDQHKLPVPVSARYFRFHPTKQHNWNCLRVELYSDTHNANDECLNYNTLSDRDRAADYFSYHTMKCDANLPQASYRFTGSAGTGMPTQCVPKMHCGTLSPGWLNGKQPSVGEGVVERMICFTKDDECCFWYSQVLVRNCSDFIVYRFGQFPTAQHFCSLRYCGTGKTGCKDKDGNIYEVGQTWNPNPLFTCRCAPNFHVLCTKTQTGCWDFHGNAFADGQEYLSNKTTKCTCSKGKITCTKFSRPACTDENGIVREHGSKWFSGACFNCSCADGLVSCVKYHVIIQYGLFRVETVGNCMPCRRPSDDILPTGSGTVSACQVYFQLKNSNELFRCSNGDFIRNGHVCNGVAECSDGSDEAQCQDAVCRDEAGQVLVLKDVWKVTECISCQCRAGLLKCNRTLQVNFPGQHDAYVPFTESCEQPSCNTAEFIRERRDLCHAIETIKDGRILLEGDTWKYKGCKFQFLRQKMTKGCPQMIGSLCNIYNGAVCCARKCAALPQLASQIRWNMTVCPGELQLRASDDMCDTPSPNCLQGSDLCEAKTLCQDEEGNVYFEGAKWLVGNCIGCRCNNGFFSCSREITFMTSDDTKIEYCNQPDCNVAAFLKSNKGICKACTWKNQTLPDGYHWKENGVDFFCSSERQRVRPGCYLEQSQVRCTAAFVGIQNLTLISDERLYLCESGDEIRSLNDWCNKKKDCSDDSDERDCAQYFCPFHTKFDLYWERTALDEIVQRNCSEVDPTLGGHFNSRCSSGSSVTKWNHKEGCYCEKEALLREFSLKLSSVNLTNLLELTRELSSEAVNFTNKELLLSYLNNLLKTGGRLLSPVNQSNDMIALNFSRAIFYTADDRSLFRTPSNSFCTRAVTSKQLWYLKYDVKKFACTAPMFSHTLAFCWSIGVLPFRDDDFAQMPAYENEPAMRPGIVQFWHRPVLRLKIDPNQLSSGSEPRGHLSFLPRNTTNEVNDSNVSAPFQHANCTWIEYDVNGTLKITAREVIDDEKERKAFVQCYLELALSSISVVAVILSLIILSCLRIRNSERIFVHKNLLLSLCLVYIVMILDTFVFTNRKQTPKLCSAMAVIQHLTHTAIFTWMLVEGIHLYIKLVKVFSVNKLYITYIIIGWGIPTVIVGLIAAIRPETYDMSKTYYKDVMCGSLKLTAEIMRDRCWLHDGEWLYKAPILAILLVNLAIFVVLLRVIFTKISTKYQTDNVEKTKRGLKSVAALLPLLGVTWLLGFVVHWSEVLLYLFIILNSLQGLAFCIFHSLLDDQIRESLVRSIRRTRMKHMARIDRSSIASTSTQLTPPGSINGRENFKHRGDIQTSKSYDTKL